MMRKLTAYLVGMLALCACSSIDCPVQHTVQSYYAIYDSNQKADTLRDTLYVFAHRTKRSDTLLLNGAPNKTAFSLPVSHTHPEDTLFFFFRNLPWQAVDTVWLKKENIPHFESVDCSASYFHRITAIRSTHNAIDSITINNSMIDYDNQRIHFHLYPKDHD